MKKDHQDKNWWFLITGLELVQNRSDLNRRIILSLFEFS